MDNKKYFNLNTNLLRLPGAFVHDVQGRTATKRCIIVPIEDGLLHEGTCGVYLSSSLQPLKKSSKNGSTHYQRVSLPKEKFESLTQSDKDKIPVLGYLTPHERMPLTVKEETPIVITDESITF